ncbi:MAG: DUF3473 domain-containing protein [Planctomycetia bacterium]|nr:DUF3473 domain-containing protein [Planctomycetia bacterium]
MLENERLRNAFSVDVEDFYQVSAFEKDIPFANWEKYPQRVVESTKRLLDLLEENSVSATFFILGWVAIHHPTLVREIANRGHEIGFHSMTHSLIYRMSPNDFRNELIEGKKVLEDIAGVRVEAFRAPSFSITKNSLWALEILVEEGFRYDSSVFPIYHDRYGISDAPKDIHEIPTPAGSLFEFPPSVVSIGRINLPVSGGGYFRLYPYSFSRFCLRRINKVEKRPFVFYVHPWEIDWEQPKLPFGSRATQFRHRVGLKGNLDKLQKLLRDFSFSKLSEVINYEIEKGAL